MSGGTWESHLLTQTQFDQLQDKPEELLRTVEQIAAEKRLAEKQLWSEQAEKENSSLRQQIDALTAERDALRSTSSSSSVPTSSEPSDHSQKPDTNTDLWVKLEKAETDYRSALGLLEIKTSRISFLEGK